MICFSDIIRAEREAADQKKRAIFQELKEQMQKDVVVSIMLLPSFAKLRGIGTLNQNLACVMYYLKTIYTFLNSIVIILK